jgi:GntR family transcriptional regulator/MocR family aminotransferase
MINLCANKVMLIDRQGNQITELAVAELLHTGEIKKHILRTQKIYEARRDYLSNLLRQELGDYVSFELADSGLAFWLRLDVSININEFIKEAEFQKVRIQMGRLFSHQENPVLGIRMGFANLNNEEVTQGVNRLKNAFARQNQNLLSA